MSPHKYINIQLSENTLNIKQILSKTKHIYQLSIIELYEFKISLKHSKSRTHDISWVL